MAEVYPGQVWIGDDYPSILILPAGRYQYIYPDGTPRGMGEADTLKLNLPSVRAIVTHWKLAAEPVPAPLTLSCPNCNRDFILQRDYLCAACREVEKEREPSS